jgi:hypothetical protein
MSTDQSGLGDIVRVLQEAEQRVRFPVGGGPEIGAANDIAGMIAKLQKLAAMPPKKLHLITVEPNGGPDVHYVAVLAESAGQAEGRARQHLGVGVAAVIPLVVDSGLASISIPRASGKPTVKIE